MKKFILLLACAAFVSAVSADEPAKKPSVAGFVSNGFWDNWEISVGAGAGTAIVNGKNPGAFGDRIGFEGDFAITKWVHPVFGVRAQLQGGYLTNFDPDRGKMEWPYVFVHADAMINFSNWAGGYRDDRAYYLVPFVGFGYLASNISSESQADNHTSLTHNFAVSYGLLNKFRLSPSFDFDLELKGLLAPSSVSPARLDGSYLFGFSVTAGFTYRFNRRGFQRGVAGYTADDIRAFQKAVADSNAALASAREENARLACDLRKACAEADAVRAVAIAEAEKAAAASAAAADAETRLSESVVLYDYGMATLTPQEKTRLQLLAEKIKQGPKDRIYRIGGHADPQTGTAVANRRLSERRAETVYRYLVSLGVDAGQLTFKGFGGENNPFGIQKANRSAIVE